MPTKINPDYQPSQRVFDLLFAYGVQRPIEFVGHEMGAFKMYWEGTGKTKCNWDSTCLTWMKRTYEDKKHQMAQNRTYSGQQGNIFESTLDRIQGKEEKKEPRIIYHNPKKEVRTGPTMTTDDALAELRRMTS